VKEKARNLAIEAHRPHLVAFLHRLILDLDCVYNSACKWYHGLVNGKLDLRTTVVGQTRGARKAGGKREARSQLARARIRTPFCTPREGNPRRGFSEGRFHSGGTKGTETGRKGMRKANRLPILDLDFGGELQRESDCERLRARLRVRAG
jgi:hypothetical protein